MKRYRRKILLLLAMILVGGFAYSVSDHIIMSPDGGDTVIKARTGGGTVELLRASASSQRLRVKPMVASDGTSAVEFPNGAAGSSASPLVLPNGATGAGSDPVEFPNSLRIAAGAGREKVLMADPSTGTAQWSEPPALSFLRKRSLNSLSALPGVTTDDLLGVAWSPSLRLLAAVSNTGTSRVFTSPNGKTWTARTAPEMNNWKSVAWSPSLALFVAVGSSGTNRVMTSSDGITWTSIPANTQVNNKSWWSVTWSPELSKFVAVGSAGVNMTSSNGTTWAPQSVSTETSGNWYRVIWVAELGLFVAVQTDDVTGAVMTSPDGVTWTKQTLPSSASLRGVAWSPELELLVVVGQSGGMVYTSPDGVTWTDRSGTAFTADQYTAVSWSPDLGAFVAVSSLGTLGQQAAASFDGISWFSIAASNPFNDLIWVSELGSFVAVGASSTNEIGLLPGW